MPRVYTRRFTVAQQKEKRRLLNHAYHLKHPRRTRWDTLKKFGWSKKRYTAVYRAQGGLCAICKKTGSLTERYKRLRPDHDHKTGQPRGLLCNKCNVALGFIDDDPLIADAIAKYLREYNQ